MEVVVAAPPVAAPVVVVIVVVLLLIAVVVAVVLLVLVVLLRIAPPVEGLVQVPTVRAVVAMVDLVVKMMTTGKVIMMKVLQ